MFLGGKKTKDTPSGVTVGASQKNKAEGQDEGGGVIFSHKLGDVLEFTMQNTRGARQWCGETMETRTKVVKPLSFVVGNTFNMH